MSFIVRVRFFHTKLIVSLKNYEKWTVFRFIVMVVLRQQTKRKAQNKKDELMFYSENCGHLFK